MAANPDARRDQMLERLVGELHQTNLHLKELVKQGARRPTFRNYDEEGTLINGRDSSKSEPNSGGVGTSSDAQG